MFSAIGQLILSFLAIFQVDSSQLALINPSIPASVPQEQVKTLPPLPRISIPDSVTAKSILVSDINRKESLAEWNADASLPIASLSKIMTGFVALKYANPETEFLISKESIGTSEAAGDFEPGEHLRLEDLITAMMMYSSNDAAMIIAENVGGMISGETYEEKISRFVEVMNENAWELNMGQTIFKNPTGLDLGPGEPSNYSSARDLERLVVAVRDKSNIIWDLSRSSEKNIYSSENKLHRLININELLGKIPHALGGKTGSTDSSGESVLVLYEYPLGQPEVLILLGAESGRRFIEGGELLKQIMPVLP